MARPPGGGRPKPGAEARALALAEELGAQLGRLKGAGPKIRQFLSMVQLGQAPEAGQVHRARTSDGEDVAVRVQHSGVADASRPNCAISSGSSSASCGVTAPSRAIRIRTTAFFVRTDGYACSTSAYCATSTPTTYTGSVTSRGRSPTTTRSASTTACRGSAICRSPNRSIATPCSSTWRPRASGCSPEASAESTPNTSTHTFELGYPPSLAVVRVYAPPESPAADAAAPPRGGPGYVAARRLPRRRRLGRDHRRAPLGRAGLNHPRTRIAPSSSGARAGSTGAIRVPRPRCPRCRASRAPRPAGCVGDRRPTDVRRYAGASARPRPPAARPAQR
jgi:ABC1 atypical kinase-like domain